MPGSSINVRPLYFYSLILLVYLLFLSGTLSRHGPTQSPIPLPAEHDCQEPGP